MTDRPLEESLRQAFAGDLPRTVLLVSDLHLGAGRDPVTGRFVRRENFLADGAFARFLEHHRSTEDESTLLVFNGDTFDFLRIVDRPRDPAGFREWSRFLARLGRSHTPEELAASIVRKEEKFGLRTDDYKSAWKLLRIARGHPVFFGALAEWIDAGGGALFVKGNHDVELHWALVREAIREVLVDRGASREAAASRVLFVEDAARIGNLYMEHGHRFERVTTVVGPPTLPGDPTQLNLPLGSFVNRYLINRLEGLEPFLDNIKPVEGVLWATLRRHPVQALRTALRSVPFLRRAVRMRRFRDGLAFVLYFGSVLALFVTAAAVVIALAVPAVRDWFAAVLGRYRVILSLAGVAGPYLVGTIRDLFTARTGRGVGEDRYGTAIHEVVRTLEPAARPGSTIYPILGHTHERDVQSLPEIDGARVLYLNSGTWAPLWPKDRPDLQGRILYPFLRFRRGAADEYGHEYLEWRDDRNAPVEAVILDRAARSARS